MALDFEQRFADERQKRARLMFAAHLAAGLALRTARSSPPTAVLLVGAFVPDFVWIALAGLGWDKAGSPTASDTWSHSVASILVLGVIYATVAPARSNRGRLLIFAAVISHLFLDALVHPQPIEMFPNAALKAAWNLWSWGQERQILGFNNYCILQAVVTALLAGIYAVRARLAGIGRASVSATLAALAFVHLVT